MGFKLNPDLVNDRKAQLLRAPEFRRQFLAALAGENNDLSPFVADWNCRPHAVEWGRLRTECFKRDNYTCTYCGVRGGRLECDHIMPLSRGGTNDPKNLTTACKPCNRAKRNKTVEEWRR